MKYSRDAFLARALEVQGDRYDLSRVGEVDSAKTEIETVCPEHGAFRIAAGKYLQGRGCPVCMKRKKERKRQETNLRKYGSTTFAGSRAAKELHEQGSGPWSKDARRKAAGTMEERFGAKTWAESETGRQALRDMCADEETRRQMSERAKSETARQHYRETSMEHCGAEHWTQSDEGRARLHELFSTDEGRLARSLRMLSPEVREKTERTNMERYGAKTWSETDEGRAVHRQLSASDEVQNRIIATKRLHGTINDSEPERQAYALLAQKFGEDDVIAQYWCERYPFKCDFHVRSLDLFIELNAYWMHGGHWFDPENPEDVAVLESWMVNPKPSYERAVYVWSFDDLRKKQTAEERGLNYLVFWDSDLCDMRKWLETM